MDITSIMNCLAERIQCGETVPIKREYQKIFKNEMKKRKIAFTIESETDGKMFVKLCEKTG